MALIPDFETGCLTFFVLSCYLQTEWKMFLILKLFGFFFFLLACLYAFQGSLGLQKFVMLLECTHMQLVVAASL